MDNYIKAALRSPCPCDNCPFRNAETTSYEVNCSEYLIACQQFERFVDGERWSGFSRWPLSETYIRIHTKDEDEE